MAQVNGQMWPLGQIAGTATNDSASAGNVGEIIESKILSGSATSLVTSTSKNVTSISLTPGDWEVYGVIYFVPAATTNVVMLFSSIAVTTNTLDTTSGAFDATSYGTGQVPGTTPNPAAHVGPIRLSLSATTTYYLVANAQFSVSTLTAYGYIKARRVR